VPRERHPSPRAALAAPAPFAILSDAMAWLVREALTHLRQGHPRAALTLASWAVQERVYEAYYGLDTSAVVSVDELQTDPALSEYYEATSYSALGRLLRDVGPRSADAGGVFLDAGCGKGRAVVVAATYPYHRVIGIEIAGRLAAVARENVRRARRHLRCPQVEVLEADAATFVIPRDVSTVYIGASFRGATLDRFIANIYDSFTATPRAINLALLQLRPFDTAGYPWLRKVREYRRVHPALPDMPMVTYTISAR
jgi:SAM-dependent methyltransferase